MTADEIIALIENMLVSFPDRMSGNEVNPTVANELRPLAVSDRRALVDALRRYLSPRVPPSKRQPQDVVAEARLWMALDIAEHLELKELRPDVELLLEAIRRGKALRPVHEKGVARYLQCLKA